MSATFVQQVGEVSVTSTALTISVTVPAGGVPAGDLLVIGACAFGVNIVGVADNRSATNIYTLEQRGSATFGSALDTGIFFCQVAVALQAGDTITMTVSAATFTDKGMKIAQFTGARTTPGIQDGQNQGKDDAFPQTTATSSGDVLTTQADVQVAVLGWFDIISTITTTSGFNAIGAVLTATNFSIYMEYRIATVKETTQSAPTVSNVTYWICMLNCFKEPVAMVHKKEFSMFPKFPLRDPSTGANSLT